jgi:hypothetical protein
MDEKQVANILVQKLKDMGFIVHRYNSVTTNSIYLKLDFGLCCGIRIADHNGKKKYHYRFNVIKDFKGDKIINFNNLVSYFFTFEELPQLLQKVQEEKQSKIQKYGINNYKLYMESEKISNDLFTRFKKVL